MSNDKKRETRQYSTEYKVEAIKLAAEIGNTKASKELGVPLSTLTQWTQAAKVGRIDTGMGTQSPKSGLTQAARIIQLEAEVKAMAKANALLRKENAFLEEASAFFAASRQKLAKQKE